MQHAGDCSNNFACGYERKKCGECIYVEIAKKKEYRSKQKEKKNKKYIMKNYLGEHWN